MVQPVCGILRIFKVSVMSVGRSAVSVAAFAVVLAFGLGCQQPELSSLAAGDEVEPVPIQRSSGSDLSDIDEFSVLPFFVPAMGPDARATDCDLSGDPYSSCI
jgi:hypothetical protein